MSSNAGKRLPPSRSRFSLSSARFPHHCSSASTHMSFAATPEPPYYAVIFSSIQRSGALSDYSATAARMLELAAEQPGFWAWRAHAPKAVGESPCRTGATARRFAAGASMPSTCWRKSGAVPSGMPDFACESLWWSMSGRFPPASSGVLLLANA